MAAPRILPKLTPETVPFWTAGKDERLLVQRCRVCTKWQHPPAERCGQCGNDVEAQPVSGDATVFSFTINEFQYHPDVDPPYAIAIVELAEQSDLRLATNIVNCEPDQVRIGMPVHVLFERHGDLFVPVFAPATHE